MNRSTEGAAEVILLGIHQRSAARIREPVIGVHVIVAAEVITYAMELIRPALGHHVDDGAARVAEFRAEIVGLDFEFLNYVTRRVELPLGNTAVLLNAGDGAAIQHDLRSAVP